VRHRVPPYRQYFSKFHMSTSDCSSVCLSPTQRKLHRIYVPQTYRNGVPPPFCPLQDASVGRIPAGNEALPGCLQWHAAVMFHEYWSTCSKVELVTDTCDKVVISVGYLTVTWNWRVVNLEVTC
jgi:hypothetical protein